MFPANVFSFLRNYRPVSVCWLTFRTNTELRPEFRYWHNSVCCAERRGNPLKQIFPPLSGSFSLRQCTFRCFSQAEFVFALLRSRKNVFYFIRPYRKQNPKNTYFNMRYTLQANRSNIKKHSVYACWKHMEFVLILNFFYWLCSQYGLTTDYADTLD